MREFDDLSDEEKAKRIKRLNREEAIFGTLGFFWHAAWIVGGLLGLVYVLVKFVQWAWAN